MPCRECRVANAASERRVAVSPALLIPRLGHRVDDTVPPGPRLYPPPGLHRVGDTVPSLHRGGTAPLLDANVSNVRGAGSPCRRHDAAWARLYPAPGLHRVGDTVPSLHRGGTAPLLDACVSNVRLTVWTIRRRLGTCCIHRQGFIVSATRRQALRRGGTASEGLIQCQGVRGHRVVDTVPPGLGCIHRQGFIVSATRCQPPGGVHRLYISRGP
jgi:hypothetical protein